MQIALLDNDTAQCDQLVAWLSAQAATVQRFTELEAMLHSLRKGEIDLMVVHSQPGIEINRLREAVEQRSPPVPMLLVTDAATVDTLSGLLTHHACDYLIKPLRRTDLLTRVHVLQKRFRPAMPAPDTNQEFGPYVFDTRAEQLSLNGQPLRLTQKEFRLALLFFRHLDRPLSRAFILESVWPEHAEFSSRSMDTHVSRVRTKLGLQPERGFRLAPVYSYGYRLEQIKA
jgi:DNA-binding response OmpR family regulator